MIDRRTLIAAGTALAAAPAFAAETPLAPAPQLRLWPGVPPGGEGLAVKDAFVLRNPQGGSPDDIAWTHLAAPYLKVTVAAKPDGRAVLLIPGGGYTRIAVGRAPSDIARLFAGQGVTAFELLYRLPHDRWAAGPDAPLQDAQRAVRLIRSLAGRYRYDANKVLALGFSAGGHLVGHLGERADDPIYAPVDAADRLSARPMAIGMFFPVVTMMGAEAHGGSRRELLGASPTEAQLAAYSLERHVPATMPPTFVCHAADDRTVPYANSIMMFGALQQAKVASEMMIAESGGHGVRLIGADGRPHVWLDLVRGFAGRHGWTAAA